MADVRGCCGQEVDPEGSPSSQKKLVKTLEKGKIYAHGNLHSFMEFVESYCSPSGPRADFLGKQVRWP